MIKNLTLLMYLVVLANSAGSLEVLHQYVVEAVGIVTCIYKNNAIH